MKITVIIIILALFAKACEKPDVQPQKPPPPHHFDRVDTPSNNKPDTVRIFKP